MNFTNVSKSTHSLDPHILVNIFSKLESVPSKSNSITPSPDREALNSSRDSRLSLSASK